MEHDTDTHHDTHIKELAIYQGRHRGFTTFDIREKGEIDTRPMEDVDDSSSEARQAEELQIRLSRLHSQMRVKIDYGRHTNILYAINGEETLRMRLTGLDDETATFFHEESKRTLVVFLSEHEWLRERLGPARIGRDMILELADFQDSQPKIILATVLDISDV